MSEQAAQTTSRDWSVEHVHFVTGRLAEYSLRQQLESLAGRLGFRYSVDVLKITVAALMTPQWVAARVLVPDEATMVLLPGYCTGDLAPVSQAVSVPVHRGPRDLRRLDEFFEAACQTDTEYGGYDIQILAEINHAPTLSLDELRKQARGLADAGADLIDVGCHPGETWSQIADAVTALRDDGHRVSVDSLNPTEIGQAVKAGAELVLSVNSDNRTAAADWGCEVVVIPDDPQTLRGMEDTIEKLAVAGVPLRIDPVLSPIGFGFTDSLRHYMEVRRRYPDAEMMMGIGNLTELTDVDSAGINVLLLAICQELGIRSVLTTQVINWARSSVKECDAARRLVYHAVRQQRLPKHVAPELVMLRDTEVPEYGEEYFRRLAGEIKDNNFRIFADGGQLHLISAGLHLKGTDPFQIFQQLLDDGAANLDRAHTFYLGYEMAKAFTALALGKDYQQDEALNWGMLTVPEDCHQRVRDPGPE